MTARRNELQKQLDKVVELNGAEAAEGADTSPPGRTKTGAGTPEPDKEPIDGHQDEESDSEEDLAEGRARLRRILWLMVRLGIPNIRPITAEDLTPEARAARTARIQQLQVQLGIQT